jgi:hypothetical protein
MIELLRNCSHGSEIATYIASTLGLEEKVKILKVASTVDGIKNLEAEVKGWNWYQKIRYSSNEQSFCKIVKKASGYCKIEIEFIDGIKADYRKGLVRNTDTIKKVIEHYSHHWPFYPIELSPLHGDLSLDNIICNSKGIHIIDWEHFSKYSAPWGFDALYFLFETLWFGMRKRKLPSKKEIEIIVTNIKVLDVDNKLDSQISKCPLKFVINFINNNSKLWGKQLSVFRNKLPILKFTPEQVSTIDDSISQNWRK